MPYVFSFDHKHRRAPMEMKDLLGGKGANLAEMTSVLGLPVPPGFTITTDACRAYLDGGWPASLDAEVAKAVRKVEKTMGKRLGDPDDPLLVSVRSGAKFSMPGMMDTVLNLGLNDASVQGLAAQTGDARFAFDSYRRFIAMYGRIVLDLDGQPFDELLDAAKDADGVTDDAKISAATLERLCGEYQDLVETATGTPFPQDPTVQLRGAIEAVFQSWGGARAIAYRERERIPHDLGTAVNVQTMVFGNRDEQSGTGVGFTRDASTGENTPYGDFLVNAQGEDVVAGIRNTEDLDALQRTFPKIHAELLKIFARLERHYRDMCDTEFTIEQGKLWMLQTRVGKRTGAAALRMAVEMTTQKGWKITQAEALQRVEADHLDQVLHPQFESGDKKVIAKGLGASPGAAVGRVYFTADDAVDASERGEAVVLVRNETRQAHRRGCAADGGRDDHPEGLEDHPGRGAPARRGRPPRPGAAPAVRGRGQAGDREGPRGLTGRRRRSRLLHRRRRRGRVRARRGGGAGAQRDVAGGRARHAGGGGDPHRPRRSREPRRRRRPGLGHPGRGRRRRGEDRRPALHRRLRHGGRGRRHLARRHHRRGGARCHGAGRRRAAGGVRHHPHVGRPRPEGASSPSAPTPTPVPTPPWRATSAPRASGSAARSTCSSPRTGSRSCGP